MKNVTLTLSEDLLRRARIEAAREGKSLSKFLAGLLEARLGRTMSQKEAFDALMKLGPMPGLSKDLPTRAELYDEIVFSGHERADLPSGQRRTRKTA
jgi:hypothetical protein